MLLELRTEKQGRPGRAELLASTGLCSEWNMARAGLPYEQRARVQTGPLAQK